jgi:hypothetical protein
MFHHRSIVYSMDLLARQLQDAEQELSLSMPYALRGRLLPPDGGAVQAVTRVSARPMGAWDHFKASVTATADVSVLVAVLRPGCTLVVRPAQRLGPDELLCSAASQRVRVACAPFECEHGREPDSAQRLRVRVLRHDEDAGEWRASMLGILPCGCGGSQVL